MQAMYVCMYVVLQYVSDLMNIRDDLVSGKNVTRYLDELLTASVGEDIKADQWKIDREIGEDFRLCKP